MEQKWMTPYDQFLAEMKIPAVFTLTHENELRVDVERTRDFFRENRCLLEDKTRLGQHHCVVIDRETSWPQYMLITHSDLCAHPRFEIFSFDDFAQAIALMNHKLLELYDRHNQTVR